MPPLGSGTWLGCVVFLLLVGSACGRTRRGFGVHTGVSDFIVQLVVGSVQWCTINFTLDPGLLRNLAANCSWLSPSLVCAWGAQPHQSRCLVPVLLFHAFFSWDVIYPINNFIVGLNLLMVSPFCNSTACSFGVCRCFPLFVCMFVVCLQVCFAVWFGGLFFYLCKCSFFLNWVVVYILVLKS